MQFRAEKSKSGKAMASSQQTHSLHELSLILSLKLISNSSRTKIKIVSVTDVKINVIVMIGEKEVALEIFCVVLIS